jgi:hypothetical protein
MSSSKIPKGSAGKPKPFRFPEAPPTSIIHSPGNPNRLKKTAAMQLASLIHDTLRELHGNDVRPSGNVTSFNEANGVWSVVFRFGDDKYVLWKPCHEPLVLLFRYHMLALNDDIELLMPIAFTTAPRGDLADFVPGLHPTRSVLGNNGFWAFE